MSSSTLRGGGLRWGVTGGFPLGHQFSSRMKYYFVWMDLPMNQIRPYRSILTIPPYVCSGFVTQRTLLHPRHSWVA
ncbi:MAG: hypothetical protein ACPL3P_01020 [Anaerolineales bacterium]